MNAIFFKLFWYKVFVRWELKLLNLLVNSVLSFTYTANGKRQIQVENFVKKENEQIKNS